MEKKTNEELQALADTAIFFPFHAVIVYRKRFSNTADCPAANYLYTIASHVCQDSGDIYAAAVGGNLLSKAKREISAEPLESQ